MFLRFVLMNATSDLLTPLLHLAETLQMFRQDHCEPNQYWMNSTRHINLKGRPKLCPEKYDLWVERDFWMTVFCDSDKAHWKVCSLGSENQMASSRQLQRYHYAPKPLCCLNEHPQLIRAPLDVKRGLRKNLFSFSVHLWQVLLHRWMAIYLGEAWTSKTLLRTLQTADIR